MIKVWNESFTDKESKDLAYWERNMVALRFAQGWYNDDIEEFSPGSEPADWGKPRFEGWRRVISLLDGGMTFHIPDDFEVGNLPQIERNWDGHTTEEKWKRVLRLREVL